MRLLLLLGAVAASCSNTASRIDVLPIAEGEWVVVAPSDDAPVLQQRIRGGRQLPRGAAPSTPGIAVLNDAIHDNETMVRAIEPLNPETLSLRVGTSTIQLLRARDAYIPLTGRPQLVQSPTNPRHYAFEHEDAIWLFTAPDSLRKLTTDDDVAALRPRQREGEAILYWSTHPVWSADGRFVSFLSNREGFRAGVPGQSLWTVDVQSGAQQPLFNAPRVSVHTEGALGAEFVFISNEQPGVLTIDPRTRRVTKRADGYVAGAHRRGEAIAVNDNGRLIVLRAQSADTLPAAPAGRNWVPNAFLSPSGERIAVFSTDNKGDYALHVFQTGSDDVLTVAVPGGPSYGPVWASEDTIIFAAMRVGGELTTYRADLH